MEEDGRKHALFDPVCQLDLWIWIHCDGMYMRRGCSAESFGAVV